MNISSIRGMQKKSKYSAPCTSMDTSSIRACRRRAHNLHEEMHALESFAQQICMSKFVKYMDNSSPFSMPCAVKYEQLKVHLPSCVVLIINDNPYELMFSLSLI
jgi:hypothetical protein